MRFLIRRRSTSDKPCPDAVPGPEPSQDYPWRGWHIEFDSLESLMARVRVPSVEHETKGEIATVNDPPQDCRFGTGLGDIELGCTNDGLSTILIVDCPDWDS